MMTDTSCYCIARLARLIRDDSRRDSAPGHAISLAEAVSVARNMVRDDSTLCPHR